MSAPIVVSCGEFKVANHKVEKIPLGGSANLFKFIIGKVYVPTKWGVRVQRDSEGVFRGFPGPFPVRS